MCLSCGTCIAGGTPRALSDFLSQGTISSDLRSYKFFFRNTILEILTLSPFSEVNSPT